MEEADQLCDRVAIMDHGRILALDTPEGAEAERRRRHDRDGQGRRRPRARSATLLDASVEGVTAACVVDGGVERARAQRRRGCCPGRAAPPSSGGFDIADLSVTEPTLETVFINLTGKELRD